MAKIEVATLGGGCFWCLEPLFDSLQGVQSVESGYSGGRVENPSYRQVCTGTTGHAEVVQVTYDPAAISYRDLLEVFFSAHDPTTQDRQGNDVGPQYRSAIFFHSPEQEQVARAAIAELQSSGDFPAPIVTEVVPFEKFYVAEDYHQEYYDRNPAQPYCRVVIAPKVAKFRKSWAERLKG
jgi:peptide-methionine (S)-S-oxide reductase